MEILYSHSGGVGGSHHIRETHMYVVVKEKNIGPNGFTADFFKAYWSSLTLISPPR
jgi:hypothetical protein